MHFFCQIWHFGETNVSCEPSTELFRNLIPGLAPTKLEPKLCTKSSVSSFINYSNARISSNLGSIGVSLGRCPDDISLLANVLRHIEHEC
jgi:hypothetical protein